MNVSDHMCFENPFSFWSYLLSLLEFELLANCLTVRRSSHTRCRSKKKRICWTVSLQVVDYPGSVGHPVRKVYHFMFEIQGYSGTCIG